MLEPISVPALNRLLRASGWALERLRAHAGKTATIVCPPFVLRLTVLDNGELAAAAAEAHSDVTIRATAPVLLRLVAGDESARGEVSVSGDMQFAAVIDYLRRTLRWDYEEDLSRVFGDVIAHRAARAGRELDRWGRAALRNVSLAFAEYWTHERPLIASSQALHDFNHDVDRLRDDAERLEKRIELLQRRLSAPEHAP